jgi:hypothetical protein
LWPFLIVALAVPAVALSEGGLRPVDVSVPERDLLRHDLCYAARVNLGGTMAYSIKPLACDPTRIKGMSEKLLVSHYENNYGGAVNRLNAITAQLAELDFAKAPGFVINGLKREELDREQLDDPA